MSVRILLPICLFVFFGLTTNAQNAPFRLEVANDIPYAFTSTKVSVEILSANIGDVEDIKWFVNNEDKIELDGQYTIDVPIFGVGNPTKVSATVTIKGREVTITEKILPISINILVEGVTHTPSSYKGLSLLSPQSPLRAMVNVQYQDRRGRMYSSDDFLIGWSLGGTGRQGLINEPDQLYIDYVTLASPESRLLSVGITNDELGIKKIKKYRYSLVEPKILLYREHPIYGPIYGRTYSSNNKIEVPNLSVFAEPFFFDEYSVENNLLTYLWTLNGEASEAKSNSVSIDPNENSLINLGLDITHKNSAYYIQQNTYETFFEF